MKNIISRDPDADPEFEKGEGAQIWQRYELDFLKVYALTVYEALEGTRHQSTQPGPYSTSETYDIYHQQSHVLYTKIGVTLK